MLVQRRGAPPRRSSLPGPVACTPAGRLARLPAAAAARARGSGAGMSGVLLLACVPGTGGTPSVGVLARSSPSQAWA